MGARLLQPGHQMRSGSELTQKKEKEKGGVRATSGSERAGTYVLHILVSARVAGVKQEECEGDGGRILLGLASVSGSRQRVIFVLLSCSCFFAR